MSNSSTAPNPGSNPPKEESETQQGIRNQLSILESKLGSYELLHLEVKSDLDSLKDQMKSCSYFLEKTVKKFEVLCDQHQDITGIISSLRANDDSELLVEETPSQDKSSDAEKLSTFAEILQKGLQKDREQSKNQPSFSNSGQTQNAGGRFDGDGFELVKPKKSIHPKPQDPKVQKYPLAKKIDSNVPESPTSSESHLDLPITSKLTETAIEKEVNERTDSNSRELHEKPSENVELVQELVQAPVEVNTERTGVAQKKEKALTKQQLKQMKDKEKRDRKKAENEAKLAAEQARLDEETKKREEFDRFVKVYINIKHVKNRPVVPGFDEEAAKKFLLDRIYNHQQRSRTDMALYCSVFLDNMCPVIVEDCRLIFELRRSSLDSLTKERTIITTIKSLALVHEAYDCIELNDTGKAKQIVQTFIDNYIVNQEKLRNERCDIPECWKGNLVLNTFLAINKSGDTKNYQWETARAFFLQVAEYYEKSDFSSKEFHKMLFIELSAKEHPMFLFDGNVLAQMESAGVSQKAVVFHYQSMMTRLETV